MGATRKPHLRPTPTPVYTLKDVEMPSVRVSGIPTIIPKFGVSFKPNDDPVPVARQEAMTKLVNGVGGGSGLKNIEASYRVVAWFWFPGPYAEGWRYSGLLKQDGTLSDLGLRYKQLAGA